MHAPPDNTPSRALEEEFTVLDWIGAIVAGSFSLALLLFPIAGQTFSSMFRDFGSSDQLPLLTQAAVSSWFPIALAAVALATLARGIRATIPLRRRRKWVVCAFLLGGFGFGLCLVGAYLPIFSLAGAVRAE